MGCLLQNEPFPNITPQVLGKSSLTGLFEDPHCQVLYALCLDEALLFTLSAKELNTELGADIRIFSSAAGSELSTPDKLHSTLWPLCCQHLLFPRMGCLLQNEPFPNITPQVLGKCSLTGLFEDPHCQVLSALCLDEALLFTPSAKELNTELGADIRILSSAAGSKTEVLTRIPLCSSHLFLPATACFLQKVPSPKFTPHVVSCSRSL
jgi:hypothetical protein